MRQKILGFCLLCISLMGSAYAQDRRISGRVTAAGSGEPLSGVSVILTGSNTGTNTDGNGNYSLNVPSNSKSITFRYIGYDTQIIPLTSTTTLNASLIENSNQLDEVVVTALGLQKEKRSLGYSIQDVKGADVVNSRETNIVNGLAGKIAGVQVTNSGGQAGSSARIIIRGNTSLTLNNQPLFVIDGIPMDNSENRAIDETVESTLFNGTEGNRAIDIDPNTIESVSVLKGAGASALYGSRGAFGVVLITTKKGSRKADSKLPRISLSSSASFDNAYTDGYQNSYLQGSLGLYKNGLPASMGGYSEAAGGSTQTSASWGPHKDSVSQAVIDSIGMPTIRDPRKAFYQTGKVWSNSISISGGGEKSNYIVTYTNLDQNGIVPNNTFKKNSLSASMTSQLSSDFSSTTNVNYTNSNNMRFAEGNGAKSFTYGLNFAPISFDSEKAYKEYGNLSWQSPPELTTGFNNPFWLVNNNSMPSEVDRIIASNEVNWNILPWLKLTNRVGIDTYTEQLSEHVDVGTKTVSNGRMYESLLKNTQLNNDLILSASKKIDDDFSFDALIGTNYNERRSATRTLRGLDLDIPGFFDITNAESQQAYQYDSKRRIVGIYGSGSLNYKDYLYLNVSARNDWSSTLPKAKNSFFYPSASLGFVFTEVLGLKDSKYFPYGKVRVSYAKAGNDATPYLTTQTYSKAAPGDGTRGEITFPYEGVNGFILSNILASNTLSPEMVTEFEVGTDLKFFENRLGLEFSYYDKKSNKQIIQQEVAGSSGFDSRVINAGEISNKGIEVVLSGTPVKTENFSWDLLVNFSRNRYKLTSIAEGVDNIFLGGFTSPQIRADKKYGYGVIWGYGWKRNDTGQRLIDDDGYPIAADEPGPIGNVMPDWTGGVRSTFRYKTLSLSALFDVKHGGDILDFDLYYTTYYGTAKVTEKRNTPTLWNGIRESDGQPNTKEVIQDQAYFQNFYTTADEPLIEDGSFLKLREITLSYSLPKSVIKKTPFESVSFSATGRNLWIHSDFSFKDPEGSLLGNGNAQGFYHAITPASKGLTFGLNITF